MPLSGLIWRRLAIECDGDAYHGPDQWESDIRRQAILERVGNCVFVRIRGSMFSRDPDAALAPLWQRIEDLRIAPWAESQPAPKPRTAEPPPPVPPDLSAVEPEATSTLLAEVVEDPPVVAPAPRASESEAATSKLVRTVLEDFQAPVASANRDDSLLHADRLREITR